MNTLHRLINPSKISQQNSSVIEEIPDKSETIFHHSFSPSTLEPFSEYKTQYKSFIEGVVYPT